ncbi:MAG: 50S ribosomal protein L30 [Fimbriimonadales bacterium]
MAAVPKNKRTVEALGLRKVGQVVIHDDNPCIRGMLHKVKHMVDVHPVEDGDAS